MNDFENMNFSENELDNNYSDYNNIQKDSISSSDKDKLGKILNYTDSINKTIGTFYEASNSLRHSQDDLISEIENINNLLKEINNIVKSVSSLADETQMISFNASIEAARAGELGKSFTVIATEIRRLSEQSKQTVSNIENFTSNIHNSIVKTGQHSKNCINSINNEISELKNIKKSIEEIQELISE